MSSERYAFTVAEFCKAHSFCRATLYHLWADGIGPDRLKVGRRIFISVEAAARWRADREASFKAAVPNEPKLAVE